MEHHLDHSQAVGDEICPCQRWSTPSSIASAISSSSEEQSLKLLEWLQGKYFIRSHDDNSNNVIDNNRRHFICSSTSYFSFRDVGKSRCINRVNVAYRILNAIRDGCREFLETNNQSTNKVLDVSYNSSDKSVFASTTSPKIQNYEDAFPSLPSMVSNPTILTARKKKKDTANNNTNTKTNTSWNKSLQGNHLQQSKGEESNHPPSPINQPILATTIKHRNKHEQKKRIRPVTTQSNASWINIKDHGNISSVPSQNVLEDHNVSFKSNNDPMERAMNSAQITSSSPKVKVKPTQKNSADPMLRLMTAPQSCSSPKDDCSVINNQDIMEPSKEIQTLAKIYSTLMENQLVPSITLELQLLLRLLVLENDHIHNHNTHHDSSKQSKATREDELYNLTASLLNSPSSCRMFAICVFSNIQSLLTNLGNEFIMTLLKLKPMLDYAPKLVDSLQRTFELKMNQSNPLLEAFQINNENSNYLGTSISGTNQVVQLTLPFEEKRDSRHNYRTPEKNLLYNNREECRDLFLFQLREFQEIRGTVLNPNQIHRSLNNVRIASRQILQQLLPSNLPWFTNFFCDLMLQIGLVPMQETDKEILKNVSDKNKLQKLHERFTSKATPKNKSSQRLSLENKDESLTTTPEQIFTGHQEFFFVFISSVDSYRFNIQLKSRLTIILNFLLSKDEIRGFEERLNKLKLVGKFLGMLTFYPNWEVKKLEADIDTDSISVLCSHTINSSIPIKEYITNGWAERKLISIIPWVVHYLSMITWDKVSMNLPYYRDIFALLRNIHKNLSHLLFKEQVANQINAIIIVFHLEVLFAEVVGLMDTESLPDHQLSELPNTESTVYCLDNIPLSFSKSFIFSSSSHFDDMQKLLQDINLHGGKLPIGNMATRKLKPYALSMNELQYLSVGNLIGNELVSMEDTMYGNKFKSLGNITQENLFNNYNMQTTLVHSFFHQHPDMKQLCEFIVDCSINNTSTLLAQEYLPRVLEQTYQEICYHEDEIPFPIDLEWYMRIHKKIESKCVVFGLERLKTECKSYISKGLKDLSPPNKSEEVKDMAASLALQYALRKGENSVTLLVRTESKKILDDHIKFLTKKNQTNQNTKRTKTVSIEKLEHKGHQDVNSKSIVELKTLIDSVMNSDSERHPEQSIFSSIELLLQKVESYFESGKSIKFKKNAHHNNFHLYNDLAKALKKVIYDWSTCTSYHQDEDRLLLRLLNILSVLKQTNIHSQDLTSLIAQLCSKQILTRIISILVSSKSNRNCDIPETVVKCLSDLLPVKDLRVALLQLLNGSTLDSEQMNECLILLGSFLEGDNRWYSSDEISVSIHRMKRVSDNAEDQY